MTSSMPYASGCWAFAVLFSVFSTNADPFVAAGPDSSCTVLGIDLTTDFATSGSMQSVPDRWLMVDVSFLLPLVDQVALVAAVVPDDEAHQDEQDADVAKSTVEDGLALGGLGRIYTNELYYKACHLVQACEEAGFDVRWGSSRCDRG
jgi:hypothetical protein